MEEINVGDVVYLKSDEEKKIKINVGRKPSIDTFNCYWFTKDGNLAIAALPEEILTK